MTNMDNPEVPAPDTDREPADSPEVETQDSDVEADDTTDDDLADAVPTDLEDDDNA